MRPSITLLALLALAGLPCAAERAPRSAHIPAGLAPSVCAEAGASHVAPNDAPAPLSVFAELTRTAGSLGATGPLSSARLGPSTPGDRAIAPDVTLPAVPVQVRAYHLASLGQRASFRRAALGTDSSPHTAPPSTLR